MESQKVKFSIIVPVYNAEKTIERCIKSVIAQYVKEWELILINDGSKDLSGNICEHWAEIESRIIYIDKENEGVSAARNRGLEVAQGEWITFIDSDDWIESSHLWEFTEQINKGTDLCINSFIGDLCYGSRSFIYPPTYAETYDKAVDLFFGVLNAHSQFLWTKAFRASLIKDHKLIFDPTISLGEDNIFILNYIRYITSLSSSSALTYHYDQTTENPNSLGRKKRCAEDCIYQIQKNTDALYHIYILTQKHAILERASNYYYTRIFERVLYPFRTAAFIGIFKIPIYHYNYTRYNTELSINYIRNKIIKKYWIYYDNALISLIVFNYYIIQEWLISKIIKTVAAAKPAAKFARNRALRWRLTMKVFYIQE